MVFAERLSLGHFRGVSRFSDLDGLALDFALSASVKLSNARIAGHNNRTGHGMGTAALVYRSGVRPSEVWHFVGNIQGLGRAR